MVLGLKTKNWNNPPVQLDYIINLVEIKPWPPSQSLRSLRSALIQWEHGDKNSGSTKAVSPSIVSGKIEFNETFRLPVILSRDVSINTFVKNCIQFNMYESRRDKTVKGQLLATAVVDFAEYGVVKESLMISVPMNCKRTFGNTAQPMLFLTIQTFKINNRVRDSLIREGSMDRNCSDSVSALMNEEYAEEAETASITDDDVSSQSSMAAASSTFGSNGSSTPQLENGFDAICESSGKVKDHEILVQDKRSGESTDLYSELENAHTTLSNFRNSRLTMITQMAESYSSQLDSGFSNGCVGTSKVLEKFKDVGIHGQNGGSKVQHLEQRVQLLEGELREAATIEVGLYSVVAEHSSSINKVHAPARRLSRLYLHTCKENSQSRRASSARSIVSGLIVVAKACGNDVPRLTFWLSNSVVLRAIIRKTFDEEQVKNAGIVEKGNNEIITPLKWNKECTLNENLCSTSNEWEDPCMVTSILEKVESWIFSRIIESIWWQTLAPYMQSTAPKATIRVVNSESNKTCQITSSSSDQDQANSSLELWKTAFMDACERICPVRAAGHDCGCLPVISRLIMEQCTARLDVAMFNAILRETANVGPTDPVSDPISDAGVLPIPPGKASFGAGAQLKNTIGNWSRWLIDLLGNDNDDSLRDDISFESFRLLGALSELMMLPKDLLLSNTIRKEVCPTFGAPLIKRILDTYVPDEFCPDPIPEVVLEALDSEDLFKSGGDDCVNSLPCAAAPIVYHPSTPLIGCILGNDESQGQLSRSGSSILRKSNTSDDELDDLDSPLTSIVACSASKKPVWTLKDADNCNTIRYQLLKEVWMRSG